MESVELVAVEIAEVGRIETAAAVSRGSLVLGPRGGADKPDTILPSWRQETRSTGGPDYITVPTAPCSRRS
jgi:hypothetical protein